MSTTPSPEPAALTAVAEEAVAAITGAFEAYAHAFSDITRRSKVRFEMRDWGAANADVTERLSLYRAWVAQAVKHARKRTRPIGDVPALWGAMRRPMARFARERDDRELAETFFNSVARRTLAHVGVDHDVEFIRQGPPEPVGPIDDRVVRSWPGTRDAAEVIAEALDAIRFDVPFADLLGCARRAAASVDTDLAGAPVDRFDVHRGVFYRHKAAYVVGRMRLGDSWRPLILALLHPPEGIVCDAALTTLDEASIVFGFTRSYFRVETPCPRDTVNFLRSMMPHKRLDELYNSIGHNKHGKTEFYGTLQRHLEQAAARFEPAEGQKGLVMEVFTLPSLNVVFKIIKDRFGFPKDITRCQVREKYRLVFVLDRVGRLADAQEYEHLAFRRDRFDDELVEALLAVARRTIHVDDERVVIRHLFTERRVTPLDLYLDQATPDAAVEAALDYGNAIKDLAAANIFPGDMLLKNFGLTRHGRVIFYDYDELCLLTECRFRPLPEATDDADEMAAEPWFHVSPGDVFPEEFQAYMSFPGALGEAFEAAHGDLFTVAFWRNMQRRQQAGELIDFFPYREERRLRRLIA